MFEHNMLFFLDSGEGTDIVTKEFEGEDLSGWLIPIEKAEGFEKDFIEFNTDYEWEDFFTFANWYKDNGKIKILFRTYDHEGNLVLELK